MTDDFVSVITKKNPLERMRNKTKRKVNKKENSLPEL
jgi:hypothetical protein